MPYKFLDKYSDLIIQNKVEIRNKILSLEMEIKKCEEKISLLEKQKANSMVGFSPFAVDRDFDREISEERNRIVELENEAERHHIFDQDLEYAIANLRSYKESIAESNAFPKIKKNITNVDALKLIENERSRIAADIHDTAVQTMTSTIHRLDLCSHLIDLDPVRCRLELKAIQRMVHDSIDTLRDVIFNLRPMYVDKIGIEVNIGRVLDHIREKYAGEVTFHVEIEDEVETLSEVIRTTMVKIIQEACTNSVKHSNATDIYVSIKIHGDDVVLNIRDNGVGIENVEDTLEKKREEEHFGFTIIEERVDFLSGKLDINTATNKGLELIITIPLNKEEIDDKVDAG